MRFLFFLLVSTLCFLPLSEVLAQNHQWKPEVGVFTGPFLVSHAREVMPSLGGRIGTRLPTNLIDVLELQAFGSNNAGVSYYLGQIGIRNEFDVAKQKGLFLFGFDWHYVRERFVEDYELSRGWHIGTGVNFRIASGLFLRNDYILRFGRERSLLVTLGLSWRFGADNRK